MNYLEIEKLTSELLMRRVGAPSISDEDDPRRVEILKILGETEEATQESEK